jgi:DNA-binding IclR family transcriptional regulator
MRGGLDDALERMARREALRRRASEVPASPSATVEEVVQAARRAVARDPELSVTVTVTYRGRSSAVRVRDEGGEVTVVVAPALPEHLAPPERVAEVEPPRPQSAASQLAELLRRSDAD